MIESISSTFEFQFYQQSLLLCISTSKCKRCLRMHFHGRKQSKTFENHEKSTFFIMHMRGSRKANKVVSLSCAWWKGTFFIIFECFLLFSTMRMHAQASVRWSKYTTTETASQCATNWATLVSRFFESNFPHVVEHFCESCLLFLCFKYFT